MSETALTGTVTNGTTQTEGGRSRAYFPREVAPPVDVFENADEILLVADVPGVAGSDIDVRLENGTLTLQARRTASPHPERALAREYEELSFVRTFRIPAGIDAANIEAEARHGTIVVRLPKSANAKPRKIQVK
jgi:HSP20 family molecular chaperone IbpA